MLIDLHMHTKPLSSCSDLDPEEAIEEAKRIGLDGICFTEHNSIWDVQDIAELSKEHNFLVLSGIEVDTSEGHILVFGLYRDFKGLTPIKELRTWADEAKGIMVAAHPFRGFLVFGFSHLGLSVEQASQKALFQFVDAIEVYSGRLTPQENDFAGQVCQKLGLKGVGGSDAHYARDIGRCITTFENKIRSQDEFVQELKAGKFTSSYFRSR